MFNPRTLRRINSRTLRHGFAAIAALLLTQTALAGLPLVCHPFATPADARLLPWGKRADHLSIDRHYDVGKLAPDTLGLLTPEASTLARMENLRRAAAYATRDVKASHELLKGLLDRLDRASADPQAAALARFDAGYLIESYRQYGMTHDVDLLSSFDEAQPGLRRSREALDGYALVEKAIAVTRDPEMEYAASLMMRDQAVGAEHRARAAAGAKEGSLLAANLKRG